MLFNPTSNSLTTLGEVLFGGKHFLYVFKHSDEPNGCPAYDNGKWVFDMLKKNNYSPSNLDLKKVHQDIMWVSIPMAVADQEWLSNDVTVKIRVTVPYQKNLWGGTTGNVGSNNGLPSYSFTTKDIATETSNNETAKSALDLITVVPNPYYAYSDYETSQLDNRVKIVNLPDKCVIKIYSINGTLVRTITKDNTMTSVDWDLKNQASIPIASGTYIIHIDAPGIGEKIIKFFGAMRPVDLNAF
jgi:hypothetical protein